MMGDGIPNKDDPYPNDPFDDRFVIVNDFDYIPSVEFVDRHYQYGVNCYKSKSDFGSYGAAIITDVVSNYMEGIGSATSLLQLFELEGTDNVNFLETYGNFCNFLSHYGDPYFKGKTLKISHNNMEEIIYTQNNNKEHYSYNVNAMSRCIEQILNKRNENVFISTNGKNDFLVCCYDALNCSHEGGYDNSESLDWGYSTGEALGGMTARAYLDGDNYHMDLRYYLIDTYEFPYHWTREDNDNCMSKYMHLMHETGNAKEYKIIGCYEESFEWKQGSILKEKYYNPKVKVFTENYDDKPVN